MSSRRKDKNKVNSNNNKNAFVRDLQEDNNNNNDKDTKKAILKSLPTVEYFQATVQKDVQQGLLKVARLKPANPIEFLGKYLLEKYKK